MKQIKIFLADDHPVVRDGLKAILSTQADFEVVGEANNGQEALKLLHDLQPDLLLLDLEMPVMDGLTLIKNLPTSLANLKILVFTVFDTDERIVQAIKAGAKGYLLKGAAREELFNAIRVVHAGGSLLQANIANKLFDHISQNKAALSPRELEVLQHLSKGLTNAEIAAELFLSERTIKFHVSAILGKLEVKTRTQAVQVALKKGIISLN
jgi:DNA-binding NarL/FixJ family response regulator